VRWLALLLLAACGTEPAALCPDGGTMHDSQHGYYRCVGIDGTQHGPFRTPHLDQDLEGNYDHDRPCGEWRFYLDGELTRTVDNAACGWSSQ